MEDRERFKCSSSLARNRIDIDIQPIHVWQSPPHTTIKNRPNLHPRLPMPIQKNRPWSPPLPTFPKPQKPQNIRTHIQHPGIFCLGGFLGFDPNYEFAFDSSIAEEYLEFCLYALHVFVPAASKTAVGVGEREGRDDGELWEGVLEGEQGGADVLRS